MLSIVEFIKKCKDIDLVNQLLCLKLKLNIKKQPIALKAGNTEYLYLYNRTEKSPNCIISNEANGLILDKEGKVVSRSLNHLYNGESFKEKIDWDKATAEEFIDGVQVTLFFYKDYWFIQTRDDINGRNLIHQNDIWSINYEVSHLLQKQRYYTNIFNQLDKDKTYTFVYVRAQEVQNLDSNKNKLYLIAIYNKETEGYLTEEELDEYKLISGFSRPRRFATVSFSYFNKRITDFSTLVVVNQDISKKPKVEQRFKFERKAETQNETSVVIKYLAEKVIQGRHQEVSLKNFPEYRRLIALFIRVKLDIISFVQKTIKENKETSLTTFSEQIKRHHLSDILIASKKTPESIRINVSRIDSSRFIKLAQIRYWTQYDDAINASKTI